MSDWIINQAGQFQFAYGKEEWRKAVENASSCNEFILDDEDELIADVDRSCYNCRFRRWTEDSFVCMKGQQR